MHDESLPGELVEVPREYKGLVLGKRGRTLKNISTQTGAKVILRDEEVYIVSGTEEQRQQATLHIKTIIVSRSMLFLYIFFQLKNFHFSLFLSTQN